jgi:hypothetical protein
MLAYRTFHKGKNILIGNFENNLSKKKKLDDLFKRNWWQARIHSFIQFNPINLIADSDFYFNLSCKLSLKYEEKQNESYVNLRASCSAVYLLQYLDLFAVISK